jgi:hypothetical protein
MKKNADIGRILCIAKYDHFQVFLAGKGWIHLPADLQDLFCFDNPSRPNAYHLKPNHNLFLFIPLWIPFVDEAARIDPVLNSFLMGRGGPEGGACAQPLAADKSHFHATWVSARFVRYWRNSCARINEM